MFLKKSLPLLTATVFLFACSKTKKTVNLLEGKWELTSTVYTESNGSTYTEDISTDSDEYPNTFYTFNSCKGKKGEWCSVTIEYIQDEEIELYQFKIIEDGARVSFRENENDSETLFKIETLDSENLTLKLEDNNDSQSHNFKKSS